MKEYETFREYFAMVKPVPRPAGALEENETEEKRVKLQELAPEEKKELWSAAYLLAMRLLRKGKYVSMLKQMQMEREECAEYCSEAIMKYLHCIYKCNPEERFVYICTIVNNEVSRLHQRYRKRQAQCTYIEDVFTHRNKHMETVTEEPEDSAAYLTMTLRPILTMCLEEICGSLTALELLVLLRTNVMKEKASEVADLLCKTAPNTALLNTAMELHARTGISTGCIQNVAAKANTVALHNQETAIYSVNNAKKRANKKLKEIRCTIFC